jgi:hypothetical protein
MKINNNELVMPNNYAVVNEEEMTYVDGGWSISTKWYGFVVTLTDHEAEVVGNASNAAAAATVFGGHPVVKAISGALWLFSADIALKNSLYHNGVTVTIKVILNNVSVSPIKPSSSGHSSSGRHR